MIGTDKKELLQQFKERRRVGGICAVRNTENDKRLILVESDLEQGRSRFEFMQKTGSCFSFKALRDWQHYGAEAFVFEILETLEQKEDQSLDEFLVDLKALEELTKEKYDRSSLYG